MNSQNFENPENDLDAKNSDPCFDAACERMLASEKKHRLKIEAFMATAPQVITCSKHPQIQRCIDFKRTEEVSRYNGKETLGYTLCPLCEQERVFKEESIRLAAQGIPLNMTHCTLENWAPTDEQGKTALAAVREFTEKRVGFLVMLGTVGTGKSHLAVGAMRTFKKALFIKQSTLLRKLRRTYEERKAEDPIELCQCADLLVLDEMGVSGGGRDEFPMLSEILDYRYGNMLPTILTSNLSWPDLKEIVGERLSDRLSESAFKVLSFGGASHRTERRSEYLHAQPMHEVLAQVRQYAQLHSRTGQPI